MKNKLARCYKALMRTLFVNSFNRDIVFLLVLSIFAGAALAGLAASTADSYFSETISGLVGDYGEFDFLINVREESKEDGKMQIEKLLAQLFPGAKVKEGPTITGLTSFLVGLPAPNKTKETYESLDSLFGSVPGRAGISIMAEPRITVKGIPAGARALIAEQIMQIDGVLFAFRDGGSVTVIIKSLEYAETVKSAAEKLLAGYKIVDIAFPAGGEPDNPIRLGEQMAEALKNEGGAGYAQNVSVDTSTDQAYLAATMLELKRFLTAYAAKITIAPQAGIHFLIGDVVVFQGTEAETPAPGTPYSAKNIVAEIIAVTEDGSGQARIMQGSAGELGENLQAFIVNQDQISIYAGVATVENPRQRLGDALNETSKVVLRIPAIAQDASNMAAIAGTALNGYNGSLETVQQTLNSLQAASSTIESATSALSNLDTASIQLQLDGSSRALGGLLNTLQIVRLLSPDAAASVEEVTQARQGIDRLQTGMKALGSVAADGKKAQAAIEDIVGNGNRTIRSLQSFDAAGAKQSLDNANRQLNELHQFDIASAAKQLEYLGASIPALRDEEITSSIKLLDGFISGQIIPRQRIQILVTRETASEAIASIVQREAGHNNLSLYNSDLGIIEPDPRAEVMVILNQVKAVLAGIISLIVVILFLVLDHTAVMSMIRRNRMMGRPLQQGGGRMVAGVKNVITALEYWYGMAVGSLMLTAMFLLSGGGIPYLPWLGVPVVGALVGLVVAGNAEKISPVSQDEVVAGEALGLSFDEIMREIVIPGSRPGLLQKLNRRKMKFK